MKKVLQTKLILLVTGMTLLFGFLVIFGIFYYTQARFVDYGELREQAMTYGEYLKEANITVQGTGLEDISHFDEVVKSAQDRMIFISLLTFVVTVLAILFIFLLVSKMVSPLYELEAAARRIQDGEYHKKVSVKQTGELKMLAQVLNHMMDRLKAQERYVDDQIRQETQTLKVKTKQLEAQHTAMLHALEHVGDEKTESERTAQELHKFKIAVDGASDHIILTDPDGTIVYANPAVERITGFSVEEILGKKAGSKQLWGGLMTEKFYRNLWQIISVKKQPFSDVFENKRKNGERYSADATITPILNENRKVLFYLGIERDITDEVEIEKAKSDFVSLASHQLRTPLTTINWYIDLLLDQSDGPINNDQKSYLETVQASSRRMAHLVTTLLNVSRLELGTFVVEPELVDLSEIVASSLDDHEASIYEKSLKIRQRYNPTIGKVALDKDLIGIVVQNIISNAVKYSVKGGIISISTGKSVPKQLNPKQKPYVVLRVKDSGVGIPKIEHKRIFTKLYRAENARSVDPSGSGLGLYMVKKILESTGGKIWFESRKGAGATFCVALPRTGMKVRKGARRLKS